MITYSQLSTADDIIALSDYFILAVFPQDEIQSVSEISSVALLQVSGHQIVRETVVRLSEYGDSETDSSPARVASGMARLLPDSDVIAEPGDLRALRLLLDQVGCEGCIRFLPVCRLAASLFPNIADGTPLEICTQLHIPDPDVDESLQPLYRLNAILRRCQVALGAELPLADGSVSDNSQAGLSKPRRRSASGRKKRISNKTLKRWSEEIWSVSPWLLVGISALVVFFVYLMMPHGEEKAADRNIAPINYLVLSWDQTGKYGVQPKQKNGEEAPIQFRIPYGVYNVLNNNSIPVELKIITEGQDEEAAPEEDADQAVAAELSTKPKSDPSDDGEEDEENTGPSKVTMRPNSTRQITVDTDQYVTLSEDAKELIFFYVSEVPEEPESDTTGQDVSTHTVVYAYVKGTEVRFRKTPSLEGQIIDSLNDGQQVQVLGVTGEWTHVSVQNQKGYIFSQYLAKEDPAAARTAGVTAQANAGAAPASDEAAPEEAAADTAPADTPAEDAASIAAEAPSEMAD